MFSALFVGDCLDHLSARVKSQSVDLIYLDPPFWSQKEHRLFTPDRTKEFSFDDTWESQSEYAQFLRARLAEMHRVLKLTGSLFFHCDSRAVAVARVLLDEIFGPEEFRNEIIWSYRRWAAGRKGLQTTHQTILWYSRSDDYKFNLILQDYSPTTNVDQILQNRTFDDYGKAVYERDDDGKTVAGPAKKGVPLTDVWDIPYLNPRAKERCGYPTQKPILLLERIIEVSTDEGDIVIDPFCGSGTTLVAAKLLKRTSIGIDVSEDAVELSKKRLENPVRSASKLMDKGRDAYATADTEALKHLGGVAYAPVHRNKGIDAILAEQYEGAPVPVRVQRKGEDLLEAGKRLLKASKNKSAKRMLLVATEPVEVLPDLPDEIYVVASLAAQI